MKLLIVEDEVKTANFPKRGFLEAGFIVSVAVDGLEGKRQIENAAFDLILLDIVLPGMDGWDILTWMRGAGLQTPVLILTARDEVADRRPESLSLRIARYPGANPDRAHVRHDDLLGQVDPLRVADPRRNRAASLLVARPSRSRPTIVGAMNSRGARVSGFSCLVSYTAWHREGAGDRELCGIPSRGAQQAN